MEKIFPLANHLATIYYVGDELLSIVWQIELTL